MFRMSITVLFTFEQNQFNIRSIRNSQAFQISDFWETSRTVLYCTYQQIDDMYQSIHKLDNMHCNVKELDDG
jgi:hypothetical protein